MKKRPKRPIRADGLQLDCCGCEGGLLKIRLCDAAGDAVAIAMLPMGDVDALVAYLLQAKEAVRGMPECDAIPAPPSLTGVVLN